MKQYVNIQEDINFTGAPIYRKVKTVKAVQNLSKEPLKIDTILSDGTFETTNTLNYGDWLVTNPGGESYSMSDKSFQKRYVHEKGDTYRAIGEVRAIQNPFGKSVEIMAPWGEIQIGDANCWFAYSIVDDSSYIIGDKEFKETYITKEQ